MVQRVAARAGTPAAVRSRAGQPPGQLVRKAGQSVQKALASSLGMDGERMSKVDTAWLRMDSPTNLMMIVGVWVFKPGVDFDALRQRLQARLSKYPRFVQRVVEDAAGASWVRDRDFDIQRHVRRGQLRRRRGQSEREALQARVAELAMQALDRRHPLWDFELIERYDGGSAMIARIHHCIGDGIALISVMMSLFDGGLPPPERHLPIWPPSATSPRPSPTPPNRATASRPTARSCCWARWPSATRSPLATRCSASTGSSAAPGRWRWRANQPPPMT